jgi:ribosomal subunit interface protein
MNITISGKQVELSDALRVHVEQDLGTIAGKYFDHAQEARVTFSRERSFFTCDIKLHPSRETTMLGTGQADTAHAAFDAAARAAAKQLRRHRRRLNEHGRTLANKEQEKARAAAAND